MYFVYMSESPMRGSVQTMEGIRRILCLAAGMILILCSAIAAAEEPAEGAEQGLDELRPLMEMTDVSETEGMSLEEMTDAYTEAAMSEYYDSITGFSMQYPSVFQFNEGGSGNAAVTSDGKASIIIDNMPNPGTLDENALIEAIRMEIPDAVPQKNDQNGCLRFDRTIDNGQAAQTDLYLLTEKSFHHITLRYPAAEKETYSAYAEYMINTMGTTGTDLG